MNSRELYLEARRLKRAKKRNEQALSEADLQGRYKKAYERLCTDLQEKQKELRAVYVKAIRLLAAVMTESVYVDPDEEDAWLDEEMNGILREAGGDPLLSELLLAFWKFGDVEEGGKKSGRKKNTKPACTAPGTSAS